MIRIRPFVPAVIWMGVIFALSSSLFAADDTGTLVKDIIHFFLPSASPDMVDALNILVRKTAHFTEYAVLAFLWHRGLAGGAGLDARKAGLTAFVISALYAASDEFHQSLVPGRGPSAMDVLLDSAGAAAACLAIWLRRKKARPA